MRPINVGALKVSYKDPMDGVSFATIPRPLPSEASAFLPMQRVCLAPHESRWGAFSCESCQRAMWFGTQSFRCLRLTRIVGAPQETGGRDS